MEMDSSISIIIPTCNRIDMLQRCLSALLPQLQNTGSATPEVIVSDDSDTGIGALLKKQFPTVKYYKGPQKGPAANRNYGAKQAQGNWLIFLDDDVIPNETLIKTYQNAIKYNPEIRVFEGKTIADRKPLNMIEESPINETGGFLWSCNFMINKKLFFAQDGFDENFPYAAMEDVDFHWRLKKKKIKILFLPDALVIHPWRLPKNIIQITKKRFKSALYFRAKHPEKKNELSSLYHFKMAVKSLKMVILKGHQYQYKGSLLRIIEGFMQIKFGFILLFKR